MHDSQLYFTILRALFTVNLKKGDTWKIVFLIVHCNKTISLVTISLQVTAYPTLPHSHGRFREAYCRTVDCERRICYFG